MKSFTHNPRARPSKPGVELPGRELQLCKAETPRGWAKDLTASGRSELGGWGLCEGLRAQGPKAAARHGRASWLWMISREWGVEDRDDLRGDLTASRPRRIFNQYDCSCNTEANISWLNGDPESIEQYSVAGLFGRFNYLQFS